MKVNLMKVCLTKVSLMKANLTKGVEEFFLNQWAHYLGSVSSGTHWGGKGFSKDFF